MPPQKRPLSPGALLTEPIVSVVRQRGATALEGSSEPKALELRATRHKRWDVPDPSDADGPLPAVQLARDEQPPCELPGWCSAPDEASPQAHIALWRQTKGHGPQELLLGRRPWVLLGRKQRVEVKGLPQPDVELRTAKASRKHAILFRNWHGQVFLMDLASAHGTFLGKERTPPQKAREWRLGVTSYFADRATETFMWRPMPLQSISQSIAPSLPDITTQPPPALRGITAIVAAASSSAATASTFINARCTGQPDSSWHESWSTLRSSPRDEGSAELLSTKELTLSEMQSTGVSEAVAKEPQGIAADLRARSMGECLQAKLCEFFGDDASVESKLEEFFLAPHYPCPRLGCSWQLSPWSQTIASYDTARPAIVITQVIVQRNSERVVCTVQWLHANIPHANLWARLTTAPFEVNEPGPNDYFHLDICLQPAEQRAGKAELCVRKEQNLPGEFYVRVYSSQALQYKGVFLGFEFGTTLRTVSGSGDEWILASSSVQASCYSKEDASQGTLRHVAEVASESGMPLS